MDKFSELYNSKYACNENTQAAREHAKEIVVEILRFEKK